MDKHKDYGIMVSGDTYHFIGFLLLVLTLIIGIVLFFIIDLIFAVLIFISGVFFGVLFMALGRALCEIKRLSKALELERKINEAEK
jgi:hypothetical protein